jgi:hypothetical protein
MEIPRMFWACGVLHMIDHVLACLKEPFGLGFLCGARTTHACGRLVEDYLDGCAVDNL